ncbi:hypothetical protein [Sphingomonas endolithica]|uniref:hypothetical protein n=1 Tax=Sphingomonas endolithica TaxID=2972485 RepID=UPI0021AE7568|nr:hypothetical protein [Sphingomonas sp. ZFBP2030]
MSAPKLRLGTTAWFEMVGALMVDAATRSGLSPKLNLSFVELYTDGVELENGLVQGICFDIIAGQPSFRVGVRPGERGDVTVEITTAAAQRLNSLRSIDPLYADAINQVLRTGEMRVNGDPSRLGGWLQELHDSIVEHTL